MKWLVVSGVAFVLMGCQRSPGAQDPLSAGPQAALAAVGGRELRGLPAEAQSDPASYVTQWLTVARYSADMVNSRPSAQRAVERAVLLRWFFDSLSTAALAEGPFTQHELAKVEQTRWQFLDRPRAVRAIEVFLPVRFVESDTLARAKMEAIREAALGAVSVDDFSARVGRVADSQRASIVARRLPPLAADGRVVPVRPGDDPKFQLTPSALCGTIATLEAAGHVSLLAGSEQGYHLFFAEEVLDARHLSEDERARLLPPWVAEVRARPELDALRQRLRSTARVQLADNALSLLERVGRRD